MASDQERNLRRLEQVTLLVLFIAVSFVCWWLYAGAGFFRDEMSYNSAFGPRKIPRIPLPAGTVPRGIPAPNRPYSPAFALQLYNDQCVFCHATSGRGDTPVGFEYDPRPPDFTQVVPLRSDQQLFASISDGMTTPEIATSPPIGPRWHQFSLYLSAADRSQLVAYLRATFGTPHSP